MARLARVVLPGYPHHITQRGNRRQDVFFSDSDYEHYLELLVEWCAYEGIEIWAYCLMTNHVHLIVKPKKKSNLGKAIGEVHRRYTRMINFRENWKGYLWQGRFASYPMDNNWLLKAAAYVELNPVKAGMVKKAWDYRWTIAGVACMPIWQEKTARRLYCRKSYFLWPEIGKPTCKKLNLIQGLNLNNMGERVGLWAVKVSSKKQSVFCIGI